MSFPVTGQMNHIGWSTGSLRLTLAKVGVHANPKSPQFTLQIPHDGISSLAALYLPSGYFDHLAETPKRVSNHSPPLLSQTGQFDYLAWWIWPAYGALRHCFCHYHFLSHRYLPQSFRLIKVSSALVEILTFKLLVISLSWLYLAQEPRWILIDAAASSPLTSF